MQTPDGQRPPAAAFAGAKATRGGVVRAFARGGADAVRLRSTMGYHVQIVYSDFTIKKEDFDRGYKSSAISTAATT